jgi:hypothetical protein
MNIKNIDEIILKKNQDETYSLDLLNITDKDLLNNISKNLHLDKVKFNTNSIIEILSKVGNDKRIIVNINVNGEVVVSDDTMYGKIEKEVK